MIDHVKMSNEATLLGNCFISVEDVAKCMIDDPINVAITHMIDKHFCYIPVLDNNDNHVVGVFSISTLMRIVGDRVANRNLAPLGSIQTYLKDHKVEAFPFVSLTDSVANVQKVWKRIQEQGKHVGLFLVTDNGKEDEPLRGIFTEWDFAKASAGSLRNKE